MADHNPNLVAIQNRALVVLLLQAGLHPVCSKSNLARRLILSSLAPTKSNSSFWSVSRERTTVTTTFDA